MQIASMANSLALVHICNNLQVLMQGTVVIKLIIPVSL